MPASPKRQGTKRRRAKSPGPRVNLKKAREALYANAEIGMPAPQTPFILRGGKTKKLRAITRKLRGLPKNVKFMGLMTHKQAHKLMRRH